MGRAEGQVAEPRTLGVERAHAADPLPRLVDDVLGEVVAVLLGRRDVDVRRAVDQVGHELVGLPAEEAVELLEALVGGPVVNGPAGVTSAFGVWCILPKAPVAYPLRLSVRARVAFEGERMASYPGSSTARFVTVPMPTLWWLRPVSRALRVGEHSAVVWNRE